MDFTDNNYKTILYFEVVWGVVGRCVGLCIGREDGVFLPDILLATILKFITLVSL